MTYKENVHDLRESPSLRLRELLEARGTVVEFHGPCIAELPTLREHPGLLGRRGVARNPDTLPGYHGAPIATDHDSIDYAALVAHCRLVVDTCNACERAGIRGAANVVKA